MLRMHLARETEGRVIRVEGLGRKRGAQHHKDQAQMRKKFQLYEKKNQARPSAAKPIGKSAAMQKEIKQT